MIYWELFYSFCVIGIFCVGGGYASVPLIQNQVIDIHHWLTLSEFMDIFAISQMTPGPIGINAATFVGTKIAGLGGAVAATLGFVTPSLFIMLALAKLLQRYGSLGAIRGILNGLRRAVAALITSAAIMFVTLSIWNVDKVSAVATMSSTDLLAVFVLVVAVIVAYKKWLGAIQTIIGGGVLYMVLQLLLH